MTAQQKARSGRPAQRELRKSGNAKVAIRIAISAFIWHCHLISATQSVLAENLIKSPPKGSALSPEKLKKIDTFFNNEISTGKIPGAILLIEQHDQPIYLHTFGLRDTDTGAPMTIDTIFPQSRVSRR